MTVRSMKRAKEQARLDKRKEKEARKAERKAAKDAAVARGEDLGDKMFGTGETFTADEAPAAPPSMITQEPVKKPFR